MKHLSLAKKIMLAAGVPLPFLLIIASMSLVQNWKNYRHASATYQDTVMVQVVSEFIHEIQKERGKSATYLNGGIELIEVKKQQEVSDSKSVGLEDVLQSSSLSEGHKSSITEAWKTIPTLRERIGAKTVTAPETIAEFTTFVEKLHNAQKSVAKMADLSGLGGEIRVMAGLEVSKENAGRFRANVASILAANKPISDLQLEKIIALKVGVEQGLHSPALQLSPQLLAKIEEVFASKSWQDVGEVFHTVIKLADKGGYGQDPKIFFKTVSAIIDSLGVLVTDEVKRVRTEASRIKQVAFRSLVSIFALLMVIAAIIFVVIRIIVRGITHSIESATSGLQGSVLQITSYAGSAKEAGAKLAAAATEAAASVQETATSVEEVSAMMNRNAENSKNASFQAGSAKERATQGQEVVTQMSQAILEINQSNATIMQDISEGNRRISEIVKLIIEIKNKTKVIDDIVFQTKLLSFNASVEAARAGDSGKGFAVVAEEVGNLARMSGTVAKEISELLGRSTEQVQEIISSTTSKLDQSFGGAKSKVDHGVMVAQRCSEVLAAIVENVNNVNQTVDEISSASREQAAGVIEINRAMGEIDKVAQENAISASESIAIAEQLSLQASQLKSIIDELQRSISGITQK